jgi:hypothetical protein
MQRSNDLVLCCNNANPVAIVNNLSFGFLLFLIFHFFKMDAKKLVMWFFAFFSFLNSYNAMDYSLHLYTLKIQTPQLTALADQSKPKW